MQSLPDIWSAAQRKALNVFFQLLGYPRRVLRFSMGSDRNVSEKKAKIAQAQGKLLERVESSAELDIIWWRASTNISI